MFIRKLDKDRILQLKNENLFTDKLLPDIKKGSVFPAIRNNEIDFYHKGGKLFGYGYNGFKTHIKYAAVIPKSKSDYLTEAELDGYKFTGFFSNYKRIRENCSKYSKDEALGVSFLCKNSSYIISGNNEVVLDIEISFEALRKGSKQDRIDILLFNKERKELRFVEAKHFSSPDLWPGRNNNRKILKQLKIYSDQSEIKNEMIIREYKNYIKIINGLFDLSLPEPIRLDQDVYLWVFGFDDYQKKGRWQKEFVDDESIHGIAYYAKGGPKGIKASDIWRKYKRK